MAVNLMAQQNNPMELILSKPLARFWYLNTVGHDPIHDFGKKSDDKRWIAKIQIIRDFIQNHIRHITPDPPRGVVPLALAAGVGLPRDHYDPNTGRQSAGMYKRTGETAGLRLGGPDNKYQLYANNYGDANFEYNYPEHDDSEDEEDDDDNHDDDDAADDIYAAQQIQQAHAANVAGGYATALFMRTNQVRVQDQNDMGHEEPDDNVINLIDDDVVINIIDPGQGNDMDEENNDEQPGGPGPVPGPAAVPGQALGQAAGPGAAAGTVPFIETSVYNLSEIYFDAINVLKELETTLQNTIQFMVFSNYLNLYHIGSAAVPNNNPGYFQFIAGAQNTRPNLMIIQIANLMIPSAEPQIGNNNLRGTIKAPVGLYNLISNKYVGWVSSKLTGNGLRITPYTVITTYSQISKTIEMFFDKTNAVKQAIAEYLNIEDVVGFMGQPLQNTTQVTNPNDNVDPLGAVPPPVFSQATSNAWNGAQAGGARDTPLNSIQSYGIITGILSAKNTANLTIQTSIGVMEQVYTLYKTQGYNGITAAQINSYGENKKFVLKMFQAIFLCDINTIETSVLVDIVRAQLETSRDIIANPPNIVPHGNAVDILTDFNNRIVGAGNDDGAKRVICDNFILLWEPQKQKAGSMFGNIEIMPFLKERFTRIIFPTVTSCLNSSIEASIFDYYKIYNLDIQSATKVQNNALRIAENDATAAINGGLTSQDSEVRSSFGKLMARATLYTNEICDFNGIVQNNFDGVNNVGPGMLYADQQAKVTGLLQSDPAIAGAPAGPNTHYLVYEISALLKISEWRAQNLGNGWSFVGNCNNDDIDDYLFTKIRNSYLSVPGVAPANVPQPNWGYRQKCHHTIANKYVISNQGDTGIVNDYVYCPLQSIVDAMPTCSWNSSQGVKELKNMNAIIRDNPRTVSYQTHVSFVNPNVSHQIQLLPSINYVNTMNGGQPFTFNLPGFDVRVPNGSHLKASTVLGQTLKVYVDLVESFNVGGQNNTPAIYSVLVTTNNPGLPPNQQFIDIFSNIYTLMNPVNVANVTNITRQNNPGQPISFQGLLFCTTYGEIEFKGSGDINQEIIAAAKNGATYGNGQRDPSVQDWNNGNKSILFISGDTVSMIRYAALIRELPGNSVNYNSFGAYNGQNQLVVRRFNNPPIDPCLCNTSKPNYNAVQCTANPLGNNVVPNANVATGGKKNKTIRKNKNKTVRKHKNKTVRKNKNKISRKNKTVRKHKIIRKHKISRK